MRLQLYVTGELPVYTMCSQFKHYVGLVNLPHSSSCPMFPYWMVLWPIVKLRVYFCLFKAPMQFSSDLLSSEYLFSAAIDASAPADLRGVALAVFWVRFRLFAMLRLHVIFLIWWIISGSSLLRNIYFDAGYRLSNMTDSRKNSATALFGLNIDNINKLASALPYSIWQ